LKTISAVQLSSTLIGAHFLSKVPSDIAIARDSEQVQGIYNGYYVLVDVPSGSGASV